jgi:hypothetical protein
VGRLTLLEAPFTAMFLIMHEDQAGQLVMFPYSLHSEVVLTGQGVQVDTHALASSDQ